jgi:5-methylcytosine-specific restriction endonuclease McrA
MTRRRRKPPTKRVGRQHAKNVTYGRQFQKIAKGVLARASYECQIRAPGCTGRADVCDHIIPWDQGGTNDPSNLRGACRSCNAFVAWHPEWRSAGLPPPGEKWPRPSFGNNCPHQADDGEWCVGQPYHWSRWWIGSPDEPYRPTNRGTK